MKHVCLLLLAVACVPEAHAQQVTRDIPYATAHERQVLDVYAPTDAKNLPVVFWIHGGGWQTGDKTMVALKPKAFMNAGFVFVSINHRLLPAVEMGAITRDVASALGWVHKNIATHGGDPTVLSHLRPATCLIVSHVRTTQIVRRQTLPAEHGGFCCPETCIACLTCAFRERRLMRRRVTHLLTTEMLEDWLGGRDSNPR